VASNQKEEEIAMPCPKCSRAWSGVNEEGRLFCECGHTEEFKLSYGELIKLYIEQDKQLANLKASEAFYFGRHNFRRRD
jgi:hypothetical protein